MRKPLVRATECRNVVMTGHELASHTSPVPVLPKSCKSSGAKSCVAHCHKLLNPTKNRKACMKKTETHNGDVTRLEHVEYGCSAKSPSQQVRPSASANLKHRISCDMHMSRF